MTTAELRQFPSYLEGPHQIDTAGGIVSSENVGNAPGSADNVVLERRHKRQAIEIGRNMPLVNVQIVVAAVVEPEHHGIRQVREIHIDVAVVAGVPAAATAVVAVVVVAVVVAAGEIVAARTVEA